MGTAAGPLVLVVKWIVASGETAWTFPASIGAVSSGKVAKTGATTSLVTVAAGVSQSAGTHTLGDWPTNWTWTSSGPSTRLPTSTSLSFSVQSWVIPSPGAGSDLKASNEPRSWSTTCTFTCSTSSAAVPLTTRPLGALAKLMTGWTAATELLPAACAGKARTAEATHAVTSPAASWRPVGRDGGRFTLVPPHRDMARGFPPPKTCVPDCSHPGGSWIRLVSTDTYPWTGK